MGGISMNFTRITMVLCFMLLLASCTFTPKLYINAGDTTMQVTQSVQPVFVANFSPNGQSLISGGQDNAVRLWDLNSAKMVMEFKGHTGEIQSVSYLSDGKTIVSKGRDQMLRFWSTTTGKEVRKITCGYGVHSLSLDDKFALVCEGQLSCESQSLYDVRTGKVIQRYHGRWGVLSPDGKFVLVGYFTKGRNIGGKLDLLASKTGETIWQTNIHLGSGLPVPFQAVATFSPDGSRIIIANKDPRNSKTSLLLIDAATGKTIKEFGHSSYGRLEYGYNEPHALAFSPDGGFAMTGSANGKYNLWDVSTGQMVREMKMIDLPNTGLNIAPSIAFSPDGRTVVVTSLGAVRLFDVANGEEIAAMIAFEDGEWIVITAEGYYNASENGAQYLNVGFEGRDYTVNQFYDVFYRPDIVVAKLSGQDIKGLFSLTMKDASRNPPPMVNIIAPKEINKSKVNICYQVKNSGGGIGEVRLFHNGKLIQSDGYYREIAKSSSAETIQLASLGSRAIYDDMRSVSLKSKTDSILKSSKSKGDVFEGCTEVDSISGENEVSITAFNGNNTVQSAIKTINFNSSIQQQDPNLYILSIGIDRYKDSTANLKYAVKDATDLEEKLKLQSATLFKPQNIHYSLLKDGEATKKNVIEKINQLSKMIKPNDSFILFVAGHGALLQNQYYMLTNDYNGQLMESSMISSNEIVEMSKKIKSLNQLFILDTCHAGGVDYIVSGLYDARMSVLAKKMGLHIYASASDKQSALDGYKGNGLFTYTLLDGLNNNRKADKNNNGKVSVEGLGEYSKKLTVEVSKQIGHAQTPLIINFGKDYPLYKLP